MGIDRVAKPVAARRANRTIKRGAKRGNRTVPADSTKDGNWALLTESYKERGIVLALGAGVSMGAQLPNWEGLLKRLTSEFSDQILPYPDLIKHGLTLPIIASILENLCEDRDDFVEQVRHALYKTFPFSPGGISKSNRRQYVRYIREKNPTLHSIATLCAVPGSKSRYDPNPKVRGIVNFNLDALVQAYIYARFEKRLLRTVERASASSSADKIHIYHVHGFLRFDEKSGDRAREAGDAVVLTERDYFNFFNDPTSLFSYTLFYLLRESPFLFIGLSMQDENIRRMLHLSKMERERSLLNEGASPAAAKRRSCRHFAILKRSESPQLDDAIKRSLLPLGTLVLWVKDWNEIHSRLRTLYESTGNSWDAVS